VKVSPNRHSPVKTQHTKTQEYELSLVASSAAEVIVPILESQGSVNSSDVSLSAQFGQHLSAAPGNLCSTYLLHRFDSRSLSEDLILWNRNHIS